MSGAESARPDLRSPRAGDLKRLTRAALAESEGRAVVTAPVRIVHLGLGAFHRAHQAWYTDQATDADGWGIAAFTGRSPLAAEQLAPQEGLYTLIERSGDGDRLSIVSSIVEANDGADLPRFLALLSAPTTAIVTLTITEPGYRLTAAAEPDQGDSLVAADIVWLRAASESGTGEASGAPTTALGRLLAGLEARRRAGSGPITIVPCDNMPDNGNFMRHGMLALAALIDVTLADWIAASVSFVSTSVDRITPQSTPGDSEIVRTGSGWIDAAPVVTEPFTDWVLSGEFPAGRPHWESAGARFVDEIEPFERRKLWLLNGAHSLLAYAGLLRGHETVAQAIADPLCRRWVDELWDEACAHLDETLLELRDYRAALLRRFSNARIEHRLAQIAQEGVTKLRVRGAAIAGAERAAGRPAAASARMIGAWIVLVRTGVQPADAKSADVERVLSGPSEEVDKQLVALIDSNLADDPLFMESVSAAVRSWA